MDTNKHNYSNNHTYKREDHAQRCRLGTSPCSYLPNEKKKGWSTEASVHVGDVFAKVLAYGRILETGSAHDAHAINLAV